MKEWKPELHSFLELIFGSAYGTKPFWITVGIAVGVLLIAGWLISNFIFSAKRGFILTFVGQALPGIAAIAGWIAVQIYAVPELNEGAIRDYLPLAGGIFAAFLATMILSRFILGISEGAAFMAVIFTYACVAGSIYLGGTLVQRVDSGIENLETQRELKEEESDSILSY